MEIPQVSRPYMPGYGIAGPTEGSGLLHLSTELPVLRRVVDLMNAKYRTDYRVDFLDPAKNATVGVRPHRVFSMRAGDFTGSPTRWTFGD
jgi:PII-like signaling protein